MCQSDIAGGDTLFCGPLRISVAAGLAIGLAVAAWSFPAAAADTPRQGSAAATGRSISRPGGHKLKWLPYRPSSPGSAGRAVAGNPGARTAAKAPLRTVQRPRGGAFADPFKDVGGSSGRPILAAAPGDNLPGGSVPADKVTPDEVPNGNVPSGNPPAAKLPEGPSGVGPTPDDSRPGFPFGNLDGGAPEAGGEVPSPSITDYPFGEEQDELIEECPSAYDPDYHTKIGDLSYDITASRGELPRECALTEETIRPFAAGEVRRNVLGQPWASTDFTWKASSLCHKPLYFEDVHLERYGHSWGPRLQPFLSGAHFFLSVPTLPYKMGLYPPGECIYTLGYYRPGSCAPYMLDPLPLSIRAALAQGAAWTGAAFVIP